MSFGEARWLLPEGEFTYGEFNLLEIAYNNAPASGARPHTRLTGNEATVVRVASGNQGT